MDTEIPKMLAGEELKQKLTYLPEYSNKINEEDDATRLCALSDLYDIYIPSKMSVEIYNKLYLAMIRSIQKKTIVQGNQQRNLNYKVIVGAMSQGIMGGSDSFSIVGDSGIGKSTTIFKAITLMQGECVITQQEPRTKIIPVIICQCPFDCSSRGMLLEILRQVDSKIGSKYYEQAVRARATVDMLIGSVSQVALNHVGMIVIDEIQNVAEHKGGHKLMAMLTQLINCSGISLCFVGTPECTILFESELRLARRSVGLRYQRMEFGEEFESFCQTLFQYQYIKTRIELTDAMLFWLYEHSAGIIAVVIALYHDAQEIAIMRAIERIDISILEEAYQQRLGMMKGYIDASIVKRSQTSTKKKISKAIQVEHSSKFDMGESVEECIMKAREEKVNVVERLKKADYILEVVV